MDEEKKVEPNIIDTLKEKAAVEGQLDSFINPSERSKNENINAASYYSGAEINTEPLIKIKEETGAIPSEISKQTRPIIRTYKSDMEETIQTGHISSINIALAENKKMFGQAKNTSVEGKKSGINKSILIISLVLVFGGALTFIIPQILSQLNYGTKTVPVEKVDSRPIMTVDTQEKINVNDIDLSRVNTTLKERIIQSATLLGQVKNIYLTEGTGTAEKLVTSARFLQLIGANIPSEIQRTLKDPYMFGSYNFNGNQTFLILKVGSFDTTYSGMLQWETNLWQDFKELFNLQSDVNATSTSFGIEIKKFQDATFDNKDARVVKDADGNIIFLYSIIDENTIVITTSTDTLKEIINRVSKARVVTQ
jgi:hypothetical protein